MVALRTIRIANIFMRPKSQDNENVVECRNRPSVGHRAL
jgi:hypothetical protein